MCSGRLLLQNRRAVIFDKKDQAGEGEYSNVVRRYGYEPIRFTADGTGTRLNLMDPMIARGTGVKGQARLLNIITRLGRGDQSLNEWEEEALRAALLTTRSADSREAARPCWPTSCRTSASWIPTATRACRPTHATSCTRPASPCAGR